MKKLMVALAAVAVAAGVQAATCDWGSGDFKTLQSCTGTCTCDNEGIQMLVWEFSAAQWAALDGRYTNVENIYKDYTGDGIKGYQNALTPVTSDWMWGTTQATGGNWELAQGVEELPVYAAVLFLHNDEGDFSKADYYMANYAEGAATSSGGLVTNLGNTIGGSGGIGGTEWTQTVPEPTSGLLLLLGVAGLALRRRRA